MQPGLHKRVISYSVDLAFSGFRSLAVSALIVNAEQMRGYWQRLWFFLQCLVVLFSMRVYTSVTIEMWHIHLVTELVIKYCSFVVSLKTDIYLPWSQRVGEWRVVSYENRQRGKKEASASPTIAISDIPVFQYGFMFSIFSSGRLTKQLCFWSPGSGFACTRARVFFSEVCVPHLGTKTRFKAHFLSTDAHQRKSGSPLGFTWPPVWSSWCCRQLWSQSPDRMLPKFRSDKCWFHFSTSPASMRGQIHHIIKKCQSWLAKIAGIVTIEIGHV